MKQSGNNPGTPVQNETLVVIKIILSFNFYFFKNHENTINSVLTDFFPRFKWHKVCIWKPNNEFLPTAIVGKGGGGIDLKRAEGVS